MKKQVLISERQSMTRKAEMFMEITVIPVREHDNSVCLSGNKDVHLDMLKLRKPRRVKYKK